MYYAKKMLTHLKLCEFISSNASKMFRFRTQGSGSESEPSLRFLFNGLAEPKT